MQLRVGCGHNSKFFEAFWSRKVLLNVFLKITYKMPVNIFQPGSRFKNGISIVI